MTAINQWLSRTRTNSASKRFVRTQTRCSSGHRIKNCRRGQRRCACRRFSVLLESYLLAKITESANSIDVCVHVAFVKGGESFPDLGIQVVKLALSIRVASFCASRVESCIRAKQTPKQFQAAIVFLGNANEVENSSTVNGERNAC